MIFDTTKPLNCDALILTPLSEADRDDLTRAASDPLTWAGHPAKDRHDPKVFGAYFDFLVVAGGAYVVRDRACDQIIGCSRYYTAPDMPQTIGIGFTFLHHDYWGGAWNRRLKALMVEHAFSQFEDVWFHIDPTNIRSQKATMKLGAVWEYDAELDLAGQPAMWKVYRLSKDAWSRTMAPQHV